MVVRFHPNTTLTVSALNSHIFTIQLTHEAELQPPAAGRDWSTVFVFGGLPQMQRLSIRLCIGRYVYNMHVRARPLLHRYCWIKPAKWWPLSDAMRHCGDVRLCSDPFLVWIVYVSVMWKVDWWVKLNFKCMVLIGSFVI